MITGDMIFLDHVYVGIIGLALVQNELTSIQSIRIANFCAKLCDVRLANQGRQTSQSLSSAKFSKNI